MGGWIISVETKTSEGIAAFIEYYGVYIGDRGAALDAIRKTLGLTSLAVPTP